MRTVVLVGLLCWLGLAGTVGADEGVLNNPSGTVELVKKVVNQLSPSYETLWNLRDGTFSQGVSASLWTATSHEIPLASLRAGFGTNESLYGGVSLDLPGLAKRYIPETIKGLATAGPLDTLWSVAGKYARVGVIGGYSWGDDGAIYGLTVGAALTW